MIVRERPPNPTLEKVTAPVHLGSSARPAVLINADDPSITAVGTISILGAVAVSFPNCALTTNVNAVGAKGLERASLVSG